MLNKSINFYVFTSITTVEIYHILVGYGPASAAENLELISISQVLKAKGCFEFRIKDRRGIGDKK